MLAACDSGGDADDARHLVMICIDDLNDYVGYLGGYRGDAQTPNLDRLAASARSYTNAHACVPACLPSRVAVLYGRKPGTTRICGEGCTFHKTPPADSDTGGQRAAPPGAALSSLPRLVKQYARADYTTMSMGKVFHSAQPDQWDVQAPFAELGEIYRRYPPDGGDLFSDGPLPPGDIHQDQLTADWASSILSKEQAKPLFMAVGLYQPHPPWRLPRWAFDLHPLESVIVPEYRPEDLDDVPPLARAMARAPLVFGEKSNFEVLQELGAQQRIVQAYLAATSHSDRMVGQILDAIDSGPNAGRTDIILWSDHGYHLGEKLHVRKGTLWEKSTRVPLIVRSPVTSPGEVVSSAVSLLDITPTVIEMTGGDPGRVIEAEKLEGHSLFGDRHSAALSWWEGAVSLRTDRWRYTRYPDDSEELYDHHSDPDEYLNLAATGERQDVLERLRVQTRVHQGGANGIESRP